MGVYEVSVASPLKVNVGEVVNITVTISLVRVNNASFWYNWTLAEGVESISVKIVEAGISMETYPCITMLTNTNFSLTKPMPNYTLNVTSIKRSLMCNSSTLKPANYSIYVLVKGFRYAMLGFSMGYFNFYIEKGASMELPLTVISEFPPSIHQNYIVAALIMVAVTATTILMLKRRRLQR
ncbi:MAG: hypothetical protein QXK47_05470 [Candidatus Bathyarchaeia archaeon]